MLLFTNNFVPTTVQRRFGSILTGGKDPTQRPLIRWFSIEIAITKIFITYEHKAER
jgi:hypothetical protein